MLWVENPDSKERSRVIPGELRRRDLIVGQHVAVSPGALPRFLAHFEQVYGGLGKVAALVCAAAAHHRLVWVHPFLDGNGRVARLMSHALLLGILDTGAVWSVARGLARNVQKYKSLLSNCDASRRADLDGRGTSAKYGPRKKSVWESFPPKPAASSKPYSIAASFHEAMSTRLPGRASGRDAGFCPR